MVFARTVTLNQRQHLDEPGVEVSGVTVNGNPCLRDQMPTQISVRCSHCIPPPTTS